MPGEDGLRDEPGYLARIKERCDALGLSEAAASTLAFGHHKGISHLRGGTKSPGLDIFVKLARVLEVSPSWLAWGAGDRAPAGARPARPASLPFMGEVAAGQWLDQETHCDVPSIKAAAIAPNPRWPADAQFVVSVRGTSIDAIVPDGAFLACVRTLPIRYQAQDGDLVIVERRRYGGSEIERTAKRFRWRGDVYELWPQSTDPSHRPIVIDPTQPDEATEVEIVGLVDRCFHTIEPDRPWERGDASDQ